MCIFCKVRDWLNWTKVYNLKDSVAQKHEVYKYYSYFCAEH